MNDPPGTIPPAAPTRLRSRRPPAHRSVSLRHSPPAAKRREDDSERKAAAVTEQLTSLSSPNPASDKANPPSVSPKLLSNKHSTGESSDAGKWFETANNNALQSNASFVENDPPFFLRNSSSSETPPDSYNMQSRVRSTMPYRTVIPNIGTDGSSTEDFRSVIDDLTIANKKLRQRLKKYEKQYDAHLEGEKLFEVRFHGLPGHKKKELEETLRKFASSLDDSTTGKLASYAHAPLEHHPTASSTSRFAESGYVSMSASGQNSSAPSNEASHYTEKIHRMSKSAYNRQQQSIQSYLHDIPVGLLPDSKAPMTDQMKKKLVVRRLEQIFAGKRSAPGTHPQPMQQEEVAQSAASADRQEREATGQQHKPEGLRVARIKPEQISKNMTVQPDSLQNLRPNLRVYQQDFAGSSSPDQRPTRPLDLDLYRAQVPVENMDYIRHLGFTPPDMNTGAAPEEDHGWIYLNLLINMAQLHTLNVTTDYVKDALHEYSNYLALSRDGRKIRWKGGVELTTHSSDTSSEQLGLSPYDNGSSPSKRLKAEHTCITKDTQLGPEARARRIAKAQREKEKKQFAYTPIFFHKEESEDEDDFYGFDVESSGNSLQRPQPAGNSSGFGSSAMQSGSWTKKPKREDGPMIFYNKAKFCTDLSGDRLGNALDLNAYKTVTSHPIGATYPSALSSSTSIVEPRGPFEGSSMEVNSNIGSKTVSSNESFGFSPHALELDDGNDSPVFIDLEASGIGGVHPEDNFSIHVRRAQKPAVPSAPAGRRRASLYPSKIQNVLQNFATQGARSASPSSRQAVIKEEILSASRRTLPNSALPPASFLPLDSTSSCDVDSDLDSMSSEEEDSESGEGPATALQLLKISAHAAGRIIDESDQDSEEESQYSEDSDDGSVDLLATARQLDPNTIRSQEREYDAAIADRLAEEIVAGSSAATAGGGSGFNTPAHDLRRSRNASGSFPNKGDQSITSGSMSSRSKLKRVRTSDSVQLKEKKKTKKSLKQND